MWLTATRGGLILGGYYPVQQNVKAKPRPGYQRPLGFPANSNVGRSVPGPTRVPGVQPLSPRQAAAIEAGVQIGILRGVARAGSRIVPGLNLAEAVLEAAYYWYRYNRDQAIARWGGRSQMSSGWEECQSTNCPRPITTAYWSTTDTCIFTSTCPTGQALPGTARDPAADIPANVKHYSLWQQTAFAPSPARYSFVRSWHRAVAAGVVTYPWTYIDPRYLDDPSWVPSVFPETIPIGLPVSTPAPAPMRRLKWRRNYRLGMAQARQAGYQLGRVELPNSPAPVGSVVVEVSPSGRVSSRQTSKPHMRRPPGREEKERKSRSPFQPTVAQAVALNALTEGGDAIEAIWNALPFEYRRSRNSDFRKRAQGWSTPSYLAMVDDIWDHPELLDMQQVAVNLAVNVVSDAVIGRLSKAASRSWYSSAYGALRAPRPGPYFSFTN